MRRKIILLHLIVASLITPVVLLVSISGGVACFDVDSVAAGPVLKRMHDKGNIMSSTPYRESYARFAPRLLNNENEIDTALAEIRAMA